MKRFIVFSTLFLLLFEVSAVAGPIDTIKGWLGNAGWVAVAAVVTFIIGLGVVHKYSDFTANLFIAVGTMFLNTGLALKDGKITGDELKQVIADVKVIGATAKAFKTAAAPEA